MPLSEQDLEDCQNLINRMPPGTYEIKEIYGEFYEAISNPKHFGRLFRESVNHGQLQHIVESHMDLGDKHWRYLLHGGA